MPKYKFHLTNGKTITLEGDTQPSDADAEAAAKEAGVTLMGADEKDSDHKPFDLQAQNAIMRKNMAAQASAGQRDLLADFANSGPMGDVSTGLTAAHEGNYAKAAHNIIKGTGQVVAPAALPFIASAPIAAIGGLVGGAIGTTAARAGTELLTNNPDYVDLAGDVGGFAGGTAGAKTAQAARGPLSKTLEFVSDVGKELDITKPLSQPARLTSYLGRKIAPAPAPTVLSEVVPIGGRTGMERPTGAKAYQPVPPSPSGAVPTLKGNTLNTPISRVDQIQGIEPPPSMEEAILRQSPEYTADLNRALDATPTLNAKGIFAQRARAGQYGPEQTAHQRGLDPSRTHGSQPTVDPISVGSPSDAELRASAARPRTTASEGDIRPQDQIIEEIRNRTNQSPELRKMLDENLQRQSDTMHAKLGNQPPRQMGAARPISLKSKAMSPAQWKENLAYYGADKLSKLTGLSRAEVIQRAGSIAGHLPLEAETQMMDIGGPR